MIKYLLFFNVFCLFGHAYAELAGGRPNAFSEGNNAFAGVVNPANNVWIANRIDVGTYLVNQKSSVDNRDDNPRYPPGKTSLTYKTRYLFTVDGAIHKHFKWDFGAQPYDSTFTLASYTVPNYLKLRTKEPFPGVGTTPIRIVNKTDVISAVFSVKLNGSHSVGISLDYLRFSHLRNGFQNADNPVRSVSPGNVTNRGMDHSSGYGFSIGWRWKITPKLNFGTAWIKKSYCGQYRKYRGYEPHHAKNYTPQTWGGGFSYRFTTRLSGRLECLWTNLGNLPGANNSLLPDGSLNLNKRGSRKSPGPGLNDATIMNIGLGYKWSEALSLGMGLSHRFKLRQRHSNFLNHAYKRQVIYDVLAFGGNYKYKKHDLFFVISKGFRNRVSGYLPEEVGGGHMVSLRQTLSLSVSWGYKY